MQVLAHSDRAGRGGNFLLFSIVRDQILKQAKDRLRPHKTNAQITEYKRDKH